MLPPKGDRLLVITFLVAVVFARSIDAARPVPCEGENFPVSFLYILSNTLVISKYLFLSLASQASPFFSPGHPILEKKDWLARLLYLYT